ncbi:MAG: hypothetical protein HGB01_06960 [Chlorobiaceae bacterium]|nr:hypothetical protein [Chlorobiaceae bacterium]
MSKTILRDQRIYLDGYEVSSRSNTCQIQASKEVKDVTTFSKTDREKLSGLFDFTFGAGGFMEIDAVDNALWVELNGSDMVVTVTSETQTVGGTAYLMKAIESSIQILGAVGDAAPFQIGAAGASMMTKGMILHLPSATITATGNGAVQQYPDASTGKKLKLAIHVLDASGTNPSLTVTLKSSAVAGMTSPMDVVVSQALTGIGAQYLEAMLTSNNTYFRLSFAVAGTSPSFTALIAFAII